MKLILGTAEFHPEGYAGKACPSIKEIIRILNLAWEGGIRTLDTAEAYNNKEVLDKYAGGFGRINKSRYEGISNCDLQYYHYKETEEPRQGITYASVYTKEQLAGLEHVIIPFSINNTLFAGPIYKRPPILRSVFDRGRLLEQGYTVKDCLSFVKRYHTEGVIVGVNSVKELEEILKSV